MVRLNGRIKKLEEAAAAQLAAQPRATWTPEEFVEWVETGIRVCLKAGWLVPIPEGGQRDRRMFGWEAVTLEVSDTVPGADDPHSQVKSKLMFLAGLPQHVVQRGLEYPGGLQAFWEGMYESERSCLMVMMIGPG